MSAEKNKALIHRWFDEVWNKGREEAIDEMFDAEGVAHGLAAADGQPLRGPGDFKPFFRAFREAFPDIRVVVEDAIAEGDKVVARCTVRGEHRGGTLGYAATQLPAEFTGISIVRLRDGKIVEAWNSFDFMSMHQQLGALTLRQD